MEVDIRTLKKKEEIKEINENIKKTQLKNELKPVKSNGLKFMNKPKFVMPQFDISQLPPRKDEESEKEIKNDFKNLIYNVASKPIQKEKQGKLNDELKNSKYLNNYIDNHAFINTLDKFNENIKALLVYSSIYLKVYSQ